MERDEIVREMEKAMALGSNDPLALEGAKGLLSAALARAEELGWKLKPREPSDKMKTAGYYGIGTTHYEPAASSKGWGDHASDIWRLMYDAED